jgi:hypothetical protein
LKDARIARTVTIGVALLGQEEQRGTDFTDFTD